MNSDAIIENTAFPRQHKEQGGGPEQDFKRIMLHTYISYYSVYI